MVNISIRLQLAWHSSPEEDLPQPGPQDILLRILRMLPARHSTKQTG